MLSEILPRLAVASQQAVSDLPADHDYDEIVTLGYFDSFSYERPSQSDTGDQYVFPDGEHDYHVFEAAVNHVRDAYERGENVLVHCQAGCSRSPTVVSVILAIENNEPFDIAVSRVRALHDSTNPTPELKRSAERYLDNHNDT